MDPALIRALDVGQVAYVYRGGVTYVQVKRLISGPAALRAPGGMAAARPASDAPGLAGPVPRPAPVHAAAAAAGPAAAGPPLPDVSELLDEAFGPEPGR